MHRADADGSTFLREMTPWLPSWKYDAVSKIRLRQSMRVYLINNGAEFHPDPIWHDGALDFFEEVAPNNKNKNNNNNNNNKMSSDMRSVTAAKRWKMT